MSNNEMISKHIIQQLNWRYATKSFMKKPISEEDFATLLEVLRLSPSSFGLEPWKFFVIENSDLRSKLHSACYGQSQIIDSDKLIVLAAKTSIDNDDVDNFIKRVAETRNIDTANLQGYAEVIKGKINQQTNADILEWNKKQTYIALGNLLNSAAMLEIDTCPMEGFDPEKVNQILSLGDQGYTSTVICTLGYRSEEDKMASLKKVRQPLSQVVEILK
jgi:nitroreductase